MGTRHKPEEIIAKLRKVEVDTGSGYVDGGCGPLDWRDEGHLLS
jgi:hypothetical protein